MDFILDGTPCTSSKYIVFNISNFMNRNNAEFIAGSYKYLHSEVDPTYLCEHFTSLSTWTKHTMLGRLRLWLFIWGGPIWFHAIEVNEKCINYSNLKNVIEKGAKIYTWFFLLKRAYDKVPIELSWGPWVRKVPIRYMNIVENMYDRVSRKCKDVYWGDDWIFNKVYWFAPIICSEHILLFHSFGWAS